MEVEIEPGQEDAGVHILWADHEVEFHRISQTQQSISHPPLLPTDVHQVVGHAGKDLYHNDKAFSIFILQSFC